jgi:ribonuclease HI
MFKIYTDGGSRGNPGPSAAGGVILSPTGSILVEISEYLDICTNNYAEYSALLITLKKAIEIHIKNVAVFMDSKLIVEQMNGNFKIKSPTLKTIYQEIKTILPNFEKITFNFIPREFNAHADSLVNKALNALKDT